MKALILIGSFGNRMRPLTLSVPKPLVEFANKSILEHQIEALVKLGCVTEVILAINFAEDVLAEKLNAFRAKVSLLILPVNYSTTSKSLAQSKTSPSEQQDLLRKLRK
jgi:mannose-1-phosphate guanylyltransferase